MSSFIVCLLSCLICITSATSNEFDVFRENKGRSLGQSSYGNGATARLTWYRLPDLVLYYLPSEGGPGKKQFNISRPLKHAFPVGWKLLFLPSIISGSPNRWLAYDEHGRFSNYDSGDEDLDYYDYSSEDPPPGCSRGITPDFVMNSLPPNAPAKNVTLNKSAFWPNAYYNAVTGSVSASDGVTLLPYICGPVASRVAKSNGPVITLFPLAAIVIGGVIVTSAVLTVLLWFGSCLFSSCRGKAV